MGMLQKKEIEFWQNYVEKDVRPPLLLPEIQEKIMSDDEWDYYFDLGFHPDYLEELERKGKK